MTLVDKESLSNEHGHLQSTDTGLTDIPDNHELMKAMTFDITI